MRFKLIFGIYLWVCVWVIISGRFDLFSRVPGRGRDIYNFTFYMLLHPSKQILINFYVFWVYKNDITVKYIT